MKKIMCITCILLICFSFAACNRENSANNATELPQEENMSGINAQVSATPERDGTKYTFEGYFTTSLPQGVRAEDKSINNDAGLFAIYDDSMTYLDVTYYETGTSDQEVAQKVKQIASTGTASEKDPITVGGIIFYGVSMPDYGKTQYMGYVNGHDVTISVYVDINNNVVQSFINHTEFTAE